MLPSLYEGFGLVALDAMARGCPSVLARAGALPETGGDAAVYFNPYEPEDAVVLTRLLADPARRAELAAAGRARAAEFTWEATAAAETLAVYEELL